MPIESFEIETSIFSKVNVYNVISQIGSVSNDPMIIKTIEIFADFKNEPRKSSICNVCIFQMHENVLQVSLVFNNKTVGPF